MSWTDERVAVLTKLWADGLSASQIAGELGGVTRNAVIGKVHRLGLSGRVKPASSNANRPKRTPRANSFGGRTRVATRPGAAGKRGNLSVISRTAVEDMVAPESKKLDLVDLTEKTCRWPHGDPATDDFHFCGHSVNEDGPYCEYHAKVAYQPTTDRRREKRAAAG